MKYQEDGIWDLFLGIFFLVDGLLMQFSSSSYIAIAAGLMIPFVYGLKKAVTIPRLGHVKFSNQRRTKEKNNMLTLFVIATMVMMLGIFVYFKSTGSASGPFFPSSGPQLILSLLFALAMTTVSLLYGIRRFLVYSVIMLFVMLNGLLLPIEFPYLLMLIGSIISVSGLTLLIKFIRRYPKVTPEGVSLD